MQCHDPRERLSLEPHGMNRSNLMHPKRLCSIPHSEVLRSLPETALLRSYLMGGHTVLESVFVSLGTLIEECSDGKRAAERLTGWS